jgi:hypothetical protein
MASRVAPLRWSSCAPRERHQEVFHADEVVLQTLGFVRRRLEDERHPGRQPYLGAVRLGQALEQHPGLLGSARRVEADLPQNGRSDAPGLLEERHQQVLGHHLGVMQLGGQLLRRQNRFLRLLGEGICVHDVPFRAVLPAVAPPASRASAS